MSKSFRSKAVLAVMLGLACTAALADGGDATYKAKCQACHGATGTPAPAMAKMMGIKPVSDPAIQALTVDQIIATIKAGKGKMKPIAGLTDPQTKDVATYYHGLK